MTTSRDVAEAAAARAGGGKTSPPTGQGGKRTQTFGPGATSSTSQVWNKPGDSWTKPGFKWKYSGGQAPDTKAQRSRVPVPGLPYTKEQPFFNPKARLDPSQVQDRRTSSSRSGGGGKF